MLKKHKGMVITLALILVLSGAFIGGTKLMQTQTETKVLASETESTDETMTPEEASMAFAKELLKDYPDIPLLQENATENYGDSSLENYINDINATHEGAKEVILQICEDAGIDAYTATVKDLTVEQIHQIDFAVYEMSTHPKN